MTKSNSPNKNSDRSRRTKTKKSDVGAKPTKTRAGAKGPPKTKVVKQKGRNKGKLVQDALVGAVQDLQGQIDAKCAVELEEKHAPLPQEPSDSSETPAVERGVARYGRFNRNFRNVLEDIAPGDGKLDDEEVLRIVTVEEKQFLEMPVDEKSDEPETGLGGERPGIPDLPRFARAQQRAASRACQLILEQRRVSENWVRRPDGWELDVEEKSYWPGMNRWIKRGSKWTRTENRNRVSGWFINPHALSAMLSLKGSVFEAAPEVGPGWYSVWCGDDSLRGGPMRSVIHGYYRVWNYTGDVVASSQKGIFVNVHEADVTLEPPSYDRETLLSCTLEGRVRNSCFAMIPRYVEMPDHNMVAMTALAVTHYRRFYPYTPSVDAKITSYLRTREFADKMRDVASANADDWKERALAMAMLRQSKYGVAPREIERSYQFYRKAYKVLDVAFTGVCCATVIGIPAALWWGFKSKYELRRKAINSLTLPVDRAPIAMKCSKLELERFTINAQRELPPVNDDSKIILNKPLELDISDIPKRMVPVEGSLVEGIPASVPAKTLSNLHAAVRIRQTFSREVDDERESELEDHYGNFCERIPYINIDTSDEAVLKYLNSHYSKKQSDKLFNMFKTMVLKDRDFKMNTFAKDECYFKNDFDNKVKTRVIISYKDVVVAWFGYVCHQITKALARHFNHDSQFYYACSSTPDILGKVAEQIEKFSKFGDADGSNFDGSLCEGILRGEVSCLTNRVSDFPGKELFLRHYINHTYSDNRKDIIVSQKHGRMSGSGLTSAFNTLSSFVLFSYCFGNVGDFKVCCLGDDLIFGCETVDEKQVEENYRQLGMKYEINIKGSMDEVEFCSGWFPPVDGHRRYANKPGKLLSKFGVNLGGVGEGYLYGIAKSLLCTSGHLPIVGILFRTICTLSEKAGLKPKVWRKQWNPYRPQGGIVLTPGVDTYQWFCRKYNTNLSEIYFVESQIKALLLSDFPLFWTHPLVKRMAQVDLDLEYEENKYAHYTVQETPERAEEITKLDGVTNIFQAWQSGYRFGAEEDRMLMARYDKDYGHRFHHAFFSTMSYLSLDYGAWLHESYNRYVESLDQPPCNKGKLKQKKDRRRKARKRRTAARKALTAAGRAVGGSFGPEFAPVGAAAGSFLSKILGSGDYVVKKNSILKGKVPDFRPSNHSIRVAHREYLGDIVGSTSFTTRTFDINPGIVQTFPWLSRMAALYTQYTVHGMVFTFNSTSASALNSTNTALGTVVMATQYNCYDSPFRTKLEMENHEYATSVRPNECAMHPIECAVGETPFRVHFVRTGALSSTEDERLYDWGKFTLATTGMQAAATIGELWVSYDIEFEKPRIDNGTFSGSRYGRISNGSWDAFDPLSPIQLGVGGNMNLTVRAPADGSSGYNSIHFDPNLVGGRFLVIITFRGGGLGGGFAVSPAYCAFANEGWHFNAISPQYTEQIEQSTISTGLYLIDVTGPNAYISITAPAFFSTASSVDVLVLQVPGPDDFPIVSGQVTLDESKEDFAIINDKRHSSVLELLRTASPSQLDELRHFLDTI